MALETSPTAPVAVRTVANAIGGWIDRLGAVWVEGQVAQLNRRPGMATVFLTLRDTVADISVTVTVARTYVDLRAAQRRLDIARQNLELQQQPLQLVQARLSAGLVGERDVAQAATNVETTRSRLPQLEGTATTARNRLAVLLGKAPGHLPLALDASEQLPSIPLRVAVGAPADLLRRRPDSGSLHAG